MKARVFLTRQEADMLLGALKAGDKDAKKLLQKVHPLYEEFRVTRKWKSMRLFLSNPDVEAVRRALAAKQKDALTASILAKIEDSKKETKARKVARTRVSLANPLASGRQRRVRLTSGRHISPR
jgi:hypothetical protein